MTESPKNMPELSALVANGFDEWESLGDVYTREWEDLILFNYKPEAQWMNRWNWFERVSRGLILDKRTGEVIARPFDKFFNWGEGDRTSNGTLVEVTGKVDGSLGILYRWNNQYRIATRGSFDGEQAIWATDFLNRNYDLTGLDPDLTLLFEIIYPENRIVVDYKGKEDLILLGARRRSNGDDFFYNPQIVDLSVRFDFSRCARYHGGDVGVYLGWAKKLNIETEGFVLRFSDGKRFKVKGDRYVEAHRFLSNSSFKNTLTLHKAGTFFNVTGNFPIDLLKQELLWMDEINAKIKEINMQVGYVFSIAPKENRKVFADFVNRQYAHLAPYLFRKLDGKDYRDLIYKLAFKDRPLDK